MTIALTEFFGMWCVASSAVGRVAGGGCNFALGRYWVYDAKDTRAINQMVKFIVAWWINFVLNIGGMYAMADLLGVNYMFSKIVVAIIFGVFVNYVMQKRFVFNT